METYNFSGDFTTFLGLVGVSSSLLIIVVAFRRFFNSPYNVRYVNRNESTASGDRTVDLDDNAGVGNSSPESSQQ